MSDKQFVNFFLVVLGALGGITALILIIASYLSSTNESIDMAMIDSLDQRLAPVGKVHIGEVAASNGGSAQQTQTAGQGGSVPAMAKTGKSIYDSACAACHIAGVAGAPRLGDKAAWNPRIAAGIEALYQSVIRGKGAMPPKGGRADLSDDDIRLAVDYMLGTLK